MADVMRPVDDSPEGPECVETSNGGHTASWYEGGKCRACGLLGPQESDFADEDPFWMTAAKVDRCLSTDELAERFDIPAETLKRHRRTGDGPPWFRFGKHVRYPEKAAAAWVESQLVHPA